MKKKGSIFIPGLEELINSKIPIDDSSLQEIVEWASKESIPILSPSSAHLLATLIRLLGVKSILELGTGAGYSLLSIAKENLNPLNICTIDRNLHQLERVQEIWTRSNYTKIHRVEFLHMHILNGLKNKFYDPSFFEFIFIDCDKITYPELLDLLIEYGRNEGTKLKYLLFDNVLWHGRILEPNMDKPSDRAMVLFWEKLESVQLKKTLIPSGDGLLFLEL
jgi:caffeoyl-CoA O-methyltransferase